MDPELGEVTDEEEEAVQAVDVRRQRARPAVPMPSAWELEWELEFKRRLAEKILEKCNSDEFTVLVPGGRRKSSGKIIRWARRQAVLAPHPSTRAKWRRFFGRYD